MARNEPQCGNLRDRLTAKIVAQSFGLLAVIVCIYFGIDYAANAMMRPPSPFEEVEEVPSLPRVLIIGDSISIGYTLSVRDCLKGVANVQRANVNCGPTTRGLKSFNQWLGDKPWNVIHFNFGLHDLKYMDKNGKLVVNTKDGIQQVPIDQYEKNLEEIIKQLRKTNAILIWRTTTPVPEGADGRIPGDVIRYNEVALKVMKKHGIPVHDLYAFCLPRLNEIQLPKNVHFTQEGSALLGKEVAKQIQKHLTHSQ